VLVCDREREQHVDLLGRHAGLGRLTVDELEQRVERAYGARTRDQLDAVLAELPALAQPGAESWEAAAKKRRGIRAADLAPYLGGSLSMIAAWALTGADYFWPIWPMLGWGVGIASHALRAQLGRPGCRAATRTGAREPLA